MYTPVYSDTQGIGLTRTYMRLYIHPHEHTCEYIHIHTYKPFDRRQCAIHGQYIYIYTPGLLGRSHNTPSKQKIHGQRQPRKRPPTAWAARGFQARVFGCQCPRCVASVPAAPPVPLTSAAEVALGASLWPPMSPLRRQCPRRAASSTDFHIYIFIQPKSI